MATASQTAESAQSVTSKIVTVRAIDMDMVICEACGCAVASDSLQLHSDWHDDLVTKTELRKARETANQERTQR